MIYGFRRVNTVGRCLDLKGDTPILTKCDDVDLSATACNVRRLDAVPAAHKERCGDLFAKSSDF